MMRLSLIALCAAIALPAVGQDAAAWLAVMDSAVDPVYNYLIAEDFSGNGNDGTCSTTNILQFVGGEWRGDFDGSSEHIKVLDAAELQLTTAFTIIIRLTFGDYTRNQDYILNKQKGVTPNDSDYALLYAYVGANIEFYASGYSGDNPRTGSSILISGNNKYHIVYTYSAGSWRGYRDGVQIFDQNKTFTLATSTGDLYLAELTPSTSRAWLGLIHEVEIYDSAITSNQVFNSYGGAAPTNAAVLNLTMQPAEE